MADASTAADDKMKDLSVSEPKKKKEPKEKKPPKVQQQPKKKVRLTARGGHMATSRADHEADRRRCAYRHRCRQRG